MEPLMIYLFGNYKALGELGTIDNKTQELAEGIFRDLRLLSHLSSVFEQKSVFTVHCTRNIVIDICK